MENIVIIGGGIAGLSLGSFIKSDTMIIEKQNKVGGLSRSYNLNGIDYDIGPHIIFSKNKTVLDLHTSLIETNKIKRSNQIVYKGRYIKYPFENDLGSLPENDKNFCLQEFLNNPYENYKANNMLQFFLKTFGEGITHTYLQPYNQKIWKFDPSCLDMQMVERIPKPPKEDVIASANGIETEGYTHQLYFHYPKFGGFQTLVNEYAKRSTETGKILTGINILSIKKSEDTWIINTDSGIINAKKIINCIPLHELFKILEAPSEVLDALNGLLFNSIHIVTMHLKKDHIGDHFALYIPEKDVIFHRLSKLDFLGDQYKRANGESTLMAEVTFRPNSYLDSLSVNDIQEKVISDLVGLNFIEKNDVVAIETRTEKYAYVIYDLDHRKNVDIVLNYLKSIGIESVGRFAEFEYLNSDAVVERSLSLADKINKGEL